MSDWDWKSVRTIAAANTLVASHLVDLLLRTRLITKDEAIAVAKAAEQEAQALRDTSGLEAAAIVGAMAEGWEQRHP